MSATDKQDQPPKNGHLEKIARGSFLLRNAALALQCARRRGRNVYHRFERSLLTPSIDRLNLEAKLRQAMEAKNEQSQS